MARTAGSLGHRTEAAIREAAATLIARRGFEAVSMRELAAEVGVQAAALYRYFPTKEDLLYTLLAEHMEALAAAWTSARPADGSARDRLAAYVGNHIGFHVARRHSTHISNMELRSLSHEHLTQILRLRAAYEKELRLILREGAENGEFTMDDLGLTAMAIIQMLTGVIVWFRPDDRLSVTQVSDTYLRLTLRLVGADKGKGDVRQHAQLRAG